ncbi:MAG: hypothetical protein QNJ70_30430 [Xenococcaceae cyanobacterium MO_207.B15]|nr:hypothetical protein [Xenococcaceae cyanobacterium MO_207.B15]
MPVTSWESEVIKRLETIALNIGAVSGNGGSVSGTATASNQEQLLASFSQFLGENATEAKQDEAIALLTKLTQQWDFANGIGNEKLKQQ